MTPAQNILLVGHGGIVDESLFFFFSERGDRVVSSCREKIDVLDPSAVDEVFRRNRFDRVVLGSVRSGGIKANLSFPADFCRENLISSALILDAAYRAGVEKLLFLSSSCVYPQDCPQPMKEDDLMTGPMEPTSEAYSAAKWAGIKLCQAYRRQYGFKAVVAVPATVYGPGMDMDEDKAHVVGALVRKLSLAREQGQSSVTLWGSGSPRREFLFGEDLARACAFLSDHYDGEQLVNIGSGQDVEIKDLAEQIAQAVGFEGQIAFDPSRPDGAPHKLLDSSLIKRLGWEPAVSLPEGLRRVCQWHQENQK